MTIVNDILQQMPAVGRPQRKCLVLVFSTILARRGRVTFRPLRRYGDDAERTIARQFRRSCDGPALHQRVMTTALHPQAEVISAQDASLIPQSGQRTFGLGHFCNGGAGRAERGLELSTLAVVDVTHRGAFTLAVAQTPPTCATVTTQDQETTLVDCYAQQLRAPRHRLPAWVAYHAVDGYFAQKKYLAAVVDLRVHPITKRRGDADGRFLFTGPHPTRRGAHRPYDGQVHGQDLSRFEALGTLAEAEHVHLDTALIWHVTRQRKVRGVILSNRKAPAKPRDLVLASTDLALDGRKLGELSGARFQSELLFRDRKQFTGLSDCQARAEAALDFHVNAALATLNFVRAEDLNAQSGEEPRVFSMASGQQCQCNERLLDFFMEK